MTTAPPRPAGTTTPARGRTARGLAVVLVAAGVLAVWLSGRRITRDGGQLSLREGYVVVGPFDVVLTPRMLLPVAVAVAVVLWGPATARRLRWPAVLAASTAGAAAWAVALALSSSWSALAAPMATEHEYVADVGRVGGLRTFLATFVDSVPVGSPDPWVTHVSGHPPGALLAFVLLDRVGLGGPGWAAALCIAGGALAVPAVLVTVRVVADEAAARTVAPFAVLLPGAVWIATSADAFFAGVTAWGVALLALAAARFPARAGWVRALAGGVLLGLSLYLSFGLAAAGLLALTVVLLQRARLDWAGVLRVLAVAAAGVLLVAALFTAGGYWWVEGIEAVSQRVRDGAAYEDRAAQATWFLAANLAAGAVAAGPAVVAGLAGVRGRVAWLPLASLGGVLVSDLSGLVLGETERIWLPFVVWLLPATASLPARSHRFWLALAALLAITVEVTVRTPW
ncbi:hypothetical protein JKP75_13140 [Blastococcus sp. TML/M2B]|uniref:hypothetical protein n=1 Tax=unclassified Blastococcus TaxID=2619396 RepID=UPI00190C6D73|nr:MULTISPECIES: hypothetical protein [unclassified Blastococcus]MBN1093422.1 hypothetical protein [Blastococcus sp. TML/M2B]MBN1096460.1 hypothetical protein [Blastococcus sp. TML/C7B]